MNFDHLVTSDGYWALALILGLEALGIPIPGETVLITAGAYAGETHKLSIWILWACGGAAVLVGSSVSYWIGVKGGYRLLLRYGKYIRMKEPEIKVGRYIFDRYGPVVVSGGRFVAVLRTYAPFLAGTSRMSWPRFATWNAIGAVAWTGLWSLLSYKAGNSLQNTSGSVDVVVAVVVVALVVAAILFIRAHAKRLEAVAEAAYPGPLAD